MLVEVCVQNLEAAAIAAEAGADRLELCENLAVGGVSPPEALSLIHISEPTRLQ